MLERDVAQGIHRLDHGYVNCYLVEGDEGGLTVIDTGLPGVWKELNEAVRELGYRLGDVRAVVLTHAHFDHVGVARRLRSRLRVPVWAHEEETYLAAHPYRYAHENVRGLYPLRYPGSVPILATMVRRGALRVRGVEATETLTGGEQLRVPGRPWVVFTPGHTFGHCALHFPERDAVISGDALVTLDPYTARTGPRIVAGAATADHDQALRSLDALAATDARLVLPGHGEPWTEGITSAVELARAAGPA